MSKYKDYAFYDFYDHKRFFKETPYSMRVYAFRWKGIKNHSKYETYRYRIKRFRFKKHKFANEPCPDCSQPLSDHGLVCVSNYAGEETWSKICPGNWLLVYKRSSYREQELWSCPHSIFKKLYKPVEEEK